MTHELLPELLIAASKYFTAQGATAPSLVCRSWYQAFAPVIWYRLSMSSCRFFGQYQPLEQLARNAHHVRELIYQNHALPAEFLSIPYANLTKLDLLCGSFVSGDLDVHFAQLVTVCQQLEDLAIVELDSESAPKTWQSIVSRPRLRVLNISGCSMTVNDFATLLRSLTSVKRLKLVENHCRGNGEAPLWDGLEILSEMDEICLDESSNVSLLKFCPNLRSLTWKGTTRDGNNSALDELRRMLQAGYLRQLDSLCFSRIKDYQRLALCMDALGRIRALDLVQDIRGGHCKPLWMALTRHFPTLEQLSYRSMERIAVVAKAFPVILSSCPRLTNFQATQLRPYQLINGEPWVCSNLRTLKIEIVINGQSMDTIRCQSRAIFGRLSQLEKLTHLEIHEAGGLTSAASRVYSQGLDLRLESGLGQLWTLKNLQYLDFGYTVQNMSAEDIAWMRKHWTRLEHVEGRCNKHGTFKQQPPSCRLTQS
ncbi:hypothetical protein BGZ93_010864 [Podila epicladia]|nr:hypothetical protein BGZ93_010864 [Podila epicladia]